MKGGQGLEILLTGGILVSGGGYHPSQVTYISIFVSEHTNVTIRLFAISAWNPINAVISVITRTYYFSYIKLSRICQSRE